MPPSPLSRCLCYDKISGSCSSSWYTQDTLSALFTSAVRKMTAMTKGGETKAFGAFQLNATMLLYSRACGKVREGGSWERRKDVWIVSLISGTGKLDPCTPQATERQQVRWALGRRDWLRAGGVLRWVRRAETKSSDPQGWVLQGTQPWTLTAFTIPGCCGGHYVYIICHSPTPNLSWEKQLLAQSQ